MAKKTTTVVEEIQQPAMAPEPEPLPETFIDDTPQDEVDLRKCFEGLGGGDIAIRVSKFEPGTNRPRYMGDAPLDITDSLESYCQTNWGEGRYILKAYKEGQVIRSRTILVGAPLNKQQPVASAPFIMPAPQPQGTDPALLVQLEILKQEAVTNREIMKAMIEKMGDGKSSVSELAQVLVTLREATKPADTVSPMKVISEAIPIIKEILHLGATKGEDDKGWLGTLKELAPEVIETVKAIAMQRAAAAGGAVATMPVNPYPPGAPAAPQIQGITAEQLAVIQGYMTKLKGRCRAGNNPQFWVDFVMNTLDEDQSVMIAKLVDRPLEEIAMVDPEILSPVYRTWMEEFFGGLRDALSQRDDAGGGEGDEANPAGHEGTDDQRRQVGSADKGTGN